MTNHRIQSEQHRAARAGDPDSFQGLTDPYRNELLVHCYRMLGSLEDAEDALQETFVRAWRRLDSLREQTALRAWLYKIATNACLDMLDRRKSRLLTVTHEPADPDDGLPAAIHEPVWLGPLPDAYLDGYVVNPESRYETLESVTLAFLTALQRLPGRQRAILILRDVLGWTAQEVAQLLSVNVAAVNSALQRARATMKKQQQELPFRALTGEDNERIARMLARYVQAWETADSASLVALLREDATLTMPPVPVWYRGRPAIRRFLDTYIFTGQPQGRFRLAATRANGCPAFGAYQRDETGIYRPGALHILTIENDQIQRIDDFLTSDSWLFSRFNLPLTA
jgi:RNA polymerase sigma-70 factor (ECF subfamily)